MPKSKLSATELIAEKGYLAQRAEKLKEDQHASDKRELEGALRAAEQHLAQMSRQASASVVRLKTPARKAKAAKHITRVIIPDSHGNHIDPVAAKAFLQDLQKLRPEQIIMLGDHLDCGGTFNSHQRSYTNEIPESYVDDIATANEFLDRICEYAPSAEVHYLEGNHEHHIERWAARNMTVKNDADLLLEVFGPSATLHLKRRGIRYYDTKSFHHGLTVRGTIRIGKCHFTHGISHSKHADSTHLERFNGNVVFGHVHRVLAVGGRTVTSTGHGAWSPGTLAKLQPLYRHTEPTTWQHGYGVQFVNASTGLFAHFNVPIFSNGITGLDPLVGALSK